MFGNAIILGLYSIRIYFDSSISASPVIKEWKQLTTTQFVMELAMVMVL